MKDSLQTLPNLAEVRELARLQARMQQPALTRAALSMRGAQSNFLSVVDPAAARFQQVGYGEVSDCLAQGISLRPWRA